LGETHEKNHKPILDVHPAHQNLIKSGSIFLDLIGIFLFRRRQIEASPTTTLLIP